MNVFLFSCCLAAAALSSTFVQGAGTYVWDFLKPALTPSELMDVLASAKPGESYPILAQIPESNFDCSAQKQPGYYADTSAQCQVFHRCDMNGNRTSYLCVNTTVFNQITLVCDYFFNVDCSKSGDFVDFANSRLYSDKPLFDTPPNDYVPPGSMGGSQPAPAPKLAKPAQGAMVRGNMKVSSSAIMLPSVSKGKAPVVKAKAAPAATTQPTTTTTPETTSTDSGNAEQSADNSDAATTPSSDADSETITAEAEITTITTAAPTTTKKAITTKAKAIMAAAPKGRTATAKKAGRR